MTVNSTWSSKGNELLRCPVEGCNHIGQVITKVHCRSEHDMTKDEVKEKFGYPKRVIMLKPSQIAGGFKK
ncbi:hypothetical protein [Lysinibacillus varians]|uniref:HNH endonuclease n=1 Tax=Lysinibacillus varians TaxID=1145276 RepID=A0ABY2TCR4_9BACI|nr:hypothetical protein [Lysinibacillus varians]AHN22716.1 hypothetical protein T479_16330 [Lysinibacillus varians]TKI66095.1 hypothetical protein FC752_05890 [Lysinibacillus varians]